MLTRRVLVTGADGLIGRRVRAAWPADRGELVAVGRSYQGRPVDLADAEDARRLVEAVRPDVVLHLVGGPSTDPVELYGRNVLTTLNVLQAVSAQAPRAAVLVTGSAAEYGPGRGQPISEDAELAPLNDYGWAKVAQTRLATAVARRHDLDLTVLRPFNVVAPDLPATTALGNIRRQLLLSTGPVRTVVCGRTDVRRDFVAVADVATVLVALSLAPPGGVLNVCSGTSCSVGEVLAEVAGRLGVDVEVSLDPDLAALPAGATVVGDPTRLSTLGLSLDGSARHVADALLGPEAHP